MRATSRHSRVVASSAIVTGRAIAERAAELPLAGVRVCGALAGLLLHRTATRRDPPREVEIDAYRHAGEYSDSGPLARCGARAIARNPSPSTTANHSVASRVRSVAVDARWLVDAALRTSNERHRALGDT